MVLGESMIGLKGNLGSYLGVLQAILGVLGAILWVQRAIFGAVESCFGIIFGVIWQILKPSWGQEGCQEPA